MWKALALDELLARLSQQTGVTLKVQQDIAEEKVVVFSTARPLRDLLYDIAALRNDTWMRQEQPGNPPTYRLVRNGRAREYENGLLEKTRNRLKLRLESQVRALAETPEEFKRRPENDPIRDRLSDPRGHLGTRFYALLDAAQRQFLFANTYFDVPYTALHPTQQEALRRAFVELNADAPFIDAKGAPATGVPKDLEHSALHFDLSDQGGRESLGFGFDPPGDGLDGVVIAAVENQTEWLLPPHGNPYTGAPISVRAVLPTPAAVHSARSNTDAKKQSWLDRLGALSERTGITICADFYRCKAAHPIKAVDPSSEVVESSTAYDSIAELDSLCQPSGYLWWMRGKTLLLRKRDWFEQRVYEVPDRWTLDVAQRLQAQQGIPTYGDVLRLLNLTTEQIAGVMSFNDTPNGEWYGDLGVMRRTVLGSRELLAIWNASPNSHAGVVPGHKTVQDAQTFQKEYEQSIRSYSEFTEPQRDLARNFVNGDYVFGMRVARRKHPVTEMELADFHTRIAAPPSAAQDTDRKGPEVTYRSMPLELWWWIEGSGTNCCRLFLPLELPQDRRDKTRIEIVP